MSPFRFSTTEIQSSSKLSPEFREWLFHQPPVDPPFTDVQQCRDLTKLADDFLRKSLDPLPPNLVEISVSIPVSSTYTTSATVVRPSKSAAQGPLIILFHPSGWFVPSTAKLIPHARGLATIFGATVISPRYRLAPENPFPTGVNDAWAAVTWAAKNIESLGADPGKGFILGGISSGANFAVVLARRAIEYGLTPMVTGIWAPLFIGMTDTTSVPEAYRSEWTSREDNYNAVVINSQKADAMFGHYQPDFASPLFNPLASSETTDFNLDKMPRTYLQVAGADFFRDDGIVLGYALQDHGVSVKLDLYPGVSHSFWLYAPEITESRKCFKDIVAGFAWLLDVNTENLLNGWETILAAMGCQPKINVSCDISDTSK